MSPSPTGILRPASESDVPGILELIAQNLDTLLPRTAKEITGLFPNAWVIAEDSDIVGFSSLEVYSPKIAEVRSVAVRGDCRKKGYGRKLVQAAIDQGRQLNIREILAITSSVEFFKELNFGLCLHEKYAMFWNGQ